MLAVLAEVGADASHVLRLGIYVLAGSDADAGYASAFAVWGAHPTAITVLGVASFARPGVLVEIEALAALRDELAGLADEIDATVETLRSLARGLQPPILDQDGVAAALRAAARGLPTQITVTADAFGRYDTAVETALYFSCLEAVQNAVRHGNADTIRVNLADEGDSVTFTVTDDGDGFDPDAPRSDGSGLTNVADRLGAMGGTLAVESSADSGARIHGRVPLD